MVAAGLYMLRQELDRGDEFLSGHINHRLGEPFVLVRQPSDTQYGIEHAGEVMRDLQYIARAATANSMSFIASQDEDVHEAAGTVRLSAVERAVEDFSFTAGAGDSFGWIAPGLRCARVERAKVYFIVDDVRRMVRLMMMLPT